jgi:hypothetical protein
MRMFMIVLATLVFSGTASAQSIDSLYTIARHDSVDIWDVRVYQNCAARYAITMTLSNDTVYVLQTDTIVQKATCTCSFNLRATVVGLSSGSYVAVVQRAQLKTYGYRVDTLIFIGSIPFATVNPNVLPFYSVAIYQSACNPSAVQIVSDRPPAAFALHQNYPNPFNPSTLITYDVSSAEHIRIEVYDASGRRISLLVDANRSPGTYSTTFDASPHLSSGVYYCRLTAGSFTQTQPMLFIK